MGVTRRERVKKIIWREAEYIPIDELKELIAIEIAKIERFVFELRANNKEAK